LVGLRFVFASLLVVCCCVLFEQIDAREE